MEIFTSAQTIVMFIVDQLIQIQNELLLTFKFHVENVQFWHPSVYTIQDFSMEKLLKCLF